MKFHRYEDALEDLLLCGIEASEPRAHCYLKLKRYT